MKTLVPILGAFEAMVEALKMKKNGRSQEEPPFRSFPRFSMASSQVRGYQPAHPLALRRLRVGVANGERTLTFMALATELLGLGALGMRQLRWLTGRLKRQNLPQTLATLLSNSC